MWFLHVDVIHLIKRHKAVRVKSTSKHKSGRLDSLSCILFYPTSVTPLISYSITFDTVSTHPKYIWNKDFFLSDYHLHNLLMNLKTVWNQIKQFYALRSLHILYIFRSTVTGVTNNSKKLLYVLPPLPYILFHKQNKVR